MTVQRIPATTYRLQLNHNFRFADARAIVGYLHELGISDIYASPIFKSKAGSLHGYDIVDPRCLNPELGSEEDFEALVKEVRVYEMGWLQDIVPNHMAYDGENQMLMDVLENGEGSEFFDYFDIDWQHPYESLRGKVLAPFLGESYGKCLEDGQLLLNYDERGLSVNYYTLRLPLHIESYSAVFDYGLNKLRKTLGDRDPDFIKVLGVLYTLKNLPPKEESPGRADQVAFVKALLWELYTGNPHVRDFMDYNLGRFRGQSGNAESFNALDRLLSGQLFRLSFWKVATEEINYRRFFIINDLISVRMEEERVFQRTHGLIFKLLEQEKITALRIDHIDGLYGPTRYLKKVREKAGNIFISVEKILGPEEELPSHWPVQGTTGYDFGRYLDGIFCDRRNEKKFQEIYARFTGARTYYPDLVSDKKRLIIGKYMAGDVDGLAHLMKNISSRDRYGSDITLYGLKRALVEVLTFFPVYRSYIDYEFYTEEDRRRVGEALKAARESNPALLLELNFIERFLLLESADGLPDDKKRQWIHFIMRFQQLTGPLMAKGFEDTTLYIYNRLLSLNEVGGEPGRFGISLEAFHEFNKRRARLWPHSMSATSTHDSKRGEDVRARIHVLSEIPDEWEKSIKRWSGLNKDKKTIVRGMEVPERNDEYFFYQTLIGGFPFSQDEYPSFCERVKSYMIKAVREAKVHTEWLKPDQRYEDAFLSFIESVLEPTESNRFLHEVVPFAKKIAHYGILNSLSQMIIKIAAPGVPDVYQGSELWNLSFVDPDNRRPVDFGKRMEFLAGIKRAEKEDRRSLINDLLAHPEDARIKLYVTYKASQFRRTQKSLFQDGGYVPIRVSGPRKENVCAFIRRNGAGWALAAAPRLLTKLATPDRLPVGEETWGETTLMLPRDAPEHWLNVLTGEELEISLEGQKKSLELRRVFDPMPLALLAAAST
ncbi:MAG: malto-oligosyltrehalose synthase [Deltaproteobacteria bacterium]|nr:malto-oligosyltrehalose synthase [Deltaproteobacteria bacterium]